MKPESLKCVLNYYLREKITSFPHDEVDGVHERYECLGGEPIDICSDRLNEFEFLYPEHAAPSLPQLHNAPLAPEVEAHARAVARQLSQMSDEFENSRSRSASVDSQPSDEGSNFVHFKKRCIFVSPNDEKVQINIIRIGSTDEVVKVKWETADKAAKSGVHYHGNSGEITFAAGETEKTVEVEIVRNCRDRNIDFIVNLLNPEGIEIGSDNPMNVFIVDHSSFVQSERQVIDNIMNIPLNASASEVAICLHDDLTPNTFRTALQYRCSYYDSVPCQLAFACELFRLSMRKASLETLGEIVCNFFKNLPELDDLTEAFQ